MTSFIKHYGRLLLVSLVSLLLPALSTAGPGHDHGDAAVATAAPASPRFSAITELFEVVGIVERDHLAVYVDRFDTNEPVTKARVEIEVGDTKLQGILDRESGEWRFPSTLFTKPGQYALVVTIEEEDNLDILASNLLIPEPATAHAHSHWRDWLLIGFGALALVLVSGLLIRRLGKRTNPFIGRRAKENSHA